MSDHATEAPRRLRAADVIDNLQDTIARLSTPRQVGASGSVELTRNAKGDVQIAVKVSDDDPAQADTKARELFDALCTAYPHGNGGQGA